MRSKLTGFQFLEITSKPNVLKSTVENTKKKKIAVSENHMISAIYILNK